MIDLAMPLFNLTPPCRQMSWTNPLTLFVPSALYVRRWGSAQTERLCSERASNAP